MGFTKTLGKINAAQRNVMRKQNKKIKVHMTGFHVFLIATLVG